MMKDFELTRREWHRVLSAGALGLAASGWFEGLAGRALATQASRPKSCILLWADGGPSHHDTFDPKPEAPADIRGPFGSIDTAVPGIRICESLPNVAREMRDGVLIRSMTTNVADHGLGRYLMHTGHPQMGTVRHPIFGSIVSHALGDPSAALPNCVVTGQVRRPELLDFLTSPGWLGARHAPLVVRDPARGVADGTTPLPQAEFDDRIALLETMQARFVRPGTLSAADEQRTAVARAVQMMRSPAAQALDLNNEPRRWTDAYGPSNFGKSCLMARRLIEVGVRFVEVYHSNWDTHSGYGSPNPRGNRLHAELDRGLSSLIVDLRERGMLQDTLIVWVGEFGRTPRTGGNGGRDHYARAFCAALFGGGIRGGQAVGRTDATGAAVEDSPCNEATFMATLCHILGIDHAREFNSPTDGRPMRYVRQGSEPLRGIL